MPEPNIDTPIIPSNQLNMAVGLHVLVVTDKFQIKSVPAYYAPSSTYVGNAFKIDIQEAFLVLFARTDQFYLQTSGNFNRNDLIYPDFWMFSHVAQNYISDPNEFEILLRNSYFNIDLLKASTSVKWRNPDNGVYFSVSGI